MAETTTRTYSHRGIDIVRDSWTRRRARTTGRRTKVAEVRWFPGHKGDGTYVGRYGAGHGYGTLREAKAAIDEHLDR